MRARRLELGDPALAEVLALIRVEFAYMDGVIDPPSSMYALTLASLSGGSEVWALGDPVCACVILTPKPPVMYLGKLAVAAASQGRGAARAMVDLACERAAALGFDAVELRTRVELTANHRVFEALGFAEVAREAHPGFDRPTAIVYQRRIA